MKSRKTNSVYFFGPGEIAAPVGIYKGRWLWFLEALDKSNINGKIITTNFMHSTKKSYHKSFPNYILLDSGFYQENISFGRFLYNAKFVINAFIWILKNKKAFDRSCFVINAIPPESFLIAIAARLVGVNKLIVDVRDMWPPKRECNKEKDLIKILWGFYSHVLTAILLNMSDHQLYTSRSYEDRLSIKKRIFLPLGIDVRRWRNSSKEWPATLTPNLNFVYVGNEASQYNLEPIFKSFFGSKHNLVVIGEQPTEFKSLYPWVNFAGYMKGDELAKILSSVDVAVLPDMTNSGVGLPNKIFDYIGALKPILVFKSQSSITEVENFILNNKIGQYFNVDSSEFDDFIKDNLEMYRKFRYNLPDITHKYSRDSLIKIFEELILN